MRQNCFVANLSDMKMQNVLCDLCESLHIMRSEFPVDLERSRAFTHYNHLTVVVTIEFGDGVGKRSVWRKTSIP